MFGIKAGDPVDPDKIILCLRVGERHLSYAIVEKPSRTLLSLGYFTGTSVNEAALDALRNIEPELKQAFPDTIVCYDYPQCMIISDGALNAETVLNTIFPAVEPPAFLTDTTNDQKRILYRVPAQVHEWISSRYKPTRFIHQYTLLLDKKTSGGEMFIDFRQEDFVLMATVHEQPVLLQTFEYINPDDVLYYLLKTCRELGFSQADVRLKISGLVDRQSVLYNTIYQYFIHSDFREIGWNLPGNQYPAHFFTTLNDLALCGS